LGKRYKVALIFGQTCSPTGEVDPRLEAKVVDVGVPFLLENENGLLVISGAVTREGFPSEAEGAMKFVPKELQPRVRLETRATSTGENVKFTREMLEQEGMPIESMLGVSTSGHKKRIVFWLERLWPEMMPRFSYQSAGKDTPRELRIHRLIYVLTRLDPNEKFA